MASRNNPYFTGVDQTLEEYIPMPMDMLLKAGQAVQGRYDKSVEDDSAMQTGLASIKTKALGHREYVNNMVNSYKAESEALIDKYGGKLENPEFIREQKRVLNKYKNDPNWTTIEDNNKAVEQAQQIEAKMKAEGKLFISPLAEFTGKDASGNLTAFTGSPELVNTLDEWESAYAIAHKSTQDIGNKTTNRVSLNNARLAMENDIKSGGVQSTKLMKAYMQSGMTAEQAKQAALSGVSSLVNKYGVDEKYNMGLLNYQQGITEFNYRKTRDAQEDQLKRDLAKKEAAGKTEEPTLKHMLTFNGTHAINTTVGDQKVITSHTSSRPVAGDGKIAPRDMKNAFQVNSDGTTKKGNFSKVDSRITKDVMIYVDDKGKIVTAPKDSKGALDMNRNAYRSNGETKAGLKPIAAREYVDAKGNRYYEPLNYKETVLSGFKPSNNVDYKPLFNIPNISKDGPVRTNSTGGVTKKIGGKISINPELQQILHNYKTQTGDTSISDAYNSKFSDIVQRFNEGKTISKQEYEDFKKFTNEVTELSYEYLNQTTIYPYLEGKPTQNSVKKQFLTPGDTPGNDLPYKAIEAEELADDNN